MFRDPLPRRLTASTGVLALDPNGWFFLSYQILDEPEVRWNQVGIPVLLRTRTGSWFKTGTYGAKFVPDPVHGALRPDPAEVQPGKHVNHVLLGSDLALTPESGIRNRSRALSGPSGCVPCTLFDPRARIPGLNPKPTRAAPQSGPKNRSPRRCPVFNPLPDRSGPADPTTEPLRPPPLVQVVAHRGGDVFGY